MRAGCFKGSVKHRDLGLNGLELGAGRSDDRRCEQVLVSSLCISFMLVKLNFGWGGGFWMLSLQASCKSILQWKVDLTLCIV